LPLRRVLAPEERSKIVVDEDPSPARFRRRDQAALGPAAHLFGVHLQKAGGLIEGERVHGLSCDGTASAAHTENGPPHMAKRFARRSEVAVTALVADMATCSMVQA
jgi:hypothetical protein